MGNRRDGVGHADNDRSRQVVDFVCIGAILLVIAILAYLDADDYYDKSAHRAAVLAVLAFICFGSAAWYQFKGPRAIRSKLRQESACNSTQVQP